MGRNTQNKGTTQDGTADDVNVWQSDGYIWSRRLDASLELLRLQERFPDQFPFLLESVTGYSSATGENSRYSLLIGFPQQVIEKFPQTEIASPVESGGSFLSEFEQAWKHHYRERNNPRFPFEGGWFVYLGFELVSEIETTVSLPKQSLPAPIALAARCPLALVLDHKTDNLHAVVECGFEALRDDFDCLLKSMHKDTKESIAAGVTSQVENLSEDDPQQYLDNVAIIKDYIVEGDVFQVNLSRRWTAQLRASSGKHAIYRKLKLTNPAPFAGSMVWNRFAVWSSSPERLVSLRGSRIDTRPIAGTRPRSSDPDQDAQLQRELLAHPKEKAEHIMLIDLERNDLGRVCEPGTIQVNELMALESYSHVHHIVSNVRGRVKPNTTPTDIIKAVFPGGTITGCPKVRCMQIIYELEKRWRGPYTGSMGYINCNGDMDLNILIRTFFALGNTLYIDAGAGIVADSDAQHELAETRAKAKGLLQAIQN